jgi:hypothetical protein
MPMKTRILLSVILMALSTWLFGQTLISEDFSASQMPPTGWTIDTNSANWLISSSSNAGGIAPEGMLSWSPQFVGDSRLISPPINTTGDSKILISFLQYVDNYGGGYTIGVATRSGGGAWNIVYSVDVNNSEGPEQESVMVTNLDVGASDFQFCFFYSGDSYQLNYWYMDNIICSVGHDINAAMSKLDIPVYNFGKVPVKGTFSNIGSNAITSMDVSYILDNGTPKTTSLTGLNLAFGQSMDFTCSDTMNPSAGNHNLKVYVGNVNGLGVDQDPSNDTLSMAFHTASGSVARFPLFEDFTSSTCDPCALFDTTFFDKFIETYGDQFSLIRYPMTWPGTGDPYANHDGYDRMNFYKVNYVPDVYVDGVQRATDSTLQVFFNNSLVNPAFMSIEARHNFFPIEIVQDTGINVKVDIHSLINADLTAYIALVEKLTYHNVATNGETEFHNSMMIMIPDGNGIPVSLTDGNLTQLEYTQSLSNTNIERWNDLMVVVWLQDPASRMVFQSAYSDTIGFGVNNLGNQENVRVYPNPTQGLIYFTGLKTIDQLTIYDFTGRSVLEIPNITNGTADLGALQEGMYYFRIQFGKNTGIGKIVKY